MISVAEDERRSREQNRELRNTSTNLKTYGALKIAGGSVIKDVGQLIISEEEKWISNSCHTQKSVSGEIKDLK